MTAYLVSDQMKLAIKFLKGFLEDRDLERRPLICISSSTMISC